MYSHKKLTTKARSWLIRRFKCGVALVEGFAFEGERPDAIGWKMSSPSSVVSYLVECKASRADFLADRRKHFRQRPERGIGNLRYYLINPGVADPSEVPEGWGLAVAHEKQIRIVKKPVRFNSAYINDAERVMLYLNLRNTKIRRGA